MTNNSNPYLSSQSLQSFAPLITKSLQAKYSSSNHMHYNRQINEILEGNATPIFICYQDNKFYDLDEQFLKREYGEEQFGKKIQILSEYYKFHRDLPTWNDKGIDQIMDKYYNKVKDVDYKKIKSVLKKEQGISLTTHKSFSSISHSDCTQKSQYSMMLKDLNKSNESLQFLQICEKIGKAFPKVKFEQNFKGCYYSGQRKFEEYLDRHKQRRQQKEKQNNQMFKKTKFSNKAITNKYQICLKQIEFSTNHAIKDTKYCTHNNTIPIEKTQTNSSNSQHSKKEKMKRQKSKTSYEPIYQNRLSKKNLENKTNFVSELVKSKIKSIKNNTKTMINNENHKNFNHIYQPTQKKNINHKIVHQIHRSSSVKTLSKLKFRSNSQSNLPDNQTFTKTNTKNQLLQRNKTYGYTQKGVPLQIGKISNTEIEQQRLLISRQSSHKILRTNSFGKFSSSNCKQYETSNIAQQNCLKKASTIMETMLQNKLRVGKS